jgi:hypothetical protein
MTLPGIVRLWGFILDFLDPDDPRPAREQIDAKYLGGWDAGPAALRFDAHSLTLSYPGDPPMRPISALLFRQELLLLFPSDWVVIVQRDKSWEVARLD